MVNHDQQGFAFAQADVVGGGGESKYGVPLRETIRGPHEPPEPIVEPPISMIWPPERPGIMESLGFAQPVNGPCGILATVQVFFDFYP
jgi:hypothetical protein